MHEFVFHLIPNAHLDPVWLWDWREGLNEGLITCRTILDLMDEDPDVTFVRGESAIYEHIQRTEPATFERIRHYVKEGRWDYVGGTYVQADTNLPATETFARQYARGQRYFAQTFGRPVRVAWAADSFGHAAGLPEVMAAAGIESFALTRGGDALSRIGSTAFWWEGPGGSRILSYHPPLGWYGTERGEVTGRMDSILAEARKGRLKTVAVFYGLGNHGGGPTRRQLADIRSWAQAHPEVQVVHSGLHRFFDALRAELPAHGADVIPVFKGELNFCLRGCYASVAKLKFAYRRAEAALQRSEKTDSVICANTGTSPADMSEAWDAVLFNSFHDILPGSSIERAYEDQLAHLGAAYHRTQRVELDALNELAAQVDTRVAKPDGDYPSGVAALLWNPHPYAVSTHMELEAMVDYRLIWSYENRPEALPLRLLGSDGQPRSFQAIATEHSSIRHVPWRKRVVFPVSLPPMGWEVVELAWVEPGAEQTARAAEPDEVGVPATASAPGIIDNGIYRVEAEVGAAGVRILRHGKPVLSGDGLSAAVFEDPWGSWGGMWEEADAIDISTLREKWTITNVHALESGPERAALWIRLAGAKSTLELTISVCRGRDVVDVGGRVLWDERCARLKLILPAGDQAEFDVPAATVSRGPSGEVPGGRWVRVHGPAGTLGFASDGLYGFDCKDGAFRATVVRASRYADDVKTAPDEDLWRPAVDRGELRFRFLISPGDAALPHLAAELEQPPLALLVPPRAGRLPRKGSLAELTPSSLQLLALKPAADGNGFVLRVRETTGQSVQAVLRWLGQELVLGSVRPHQLACWRLKRLGSGWQAERTTLVE